MLLLLSNELNAEINSLCKCVERFQLLSGIHNNQNNKK